MPPRIALIHAVATAIPPIQHAFKEDWPEATLSNLLDDDLMPAYTREGGLTPHITERICGLALYAARSGADGILFTCSVFPQAEDMAKQLVRIPLLKPDEAMDMVKKDRASPSGPNVYRALTFPSSSNRKITARPSSTRNVSAFGGSRCL